MNAIELLQAVAQTIWVAVAVVAVVGAARAPSRSSIDIALFFGAIGVVLVEGRAAAFLGLPADDPLSRILIALVWALPYLLLRLTHDFAGVPRAIRTVTVIGAIASAAILLTVSPPRLQQAVPALLYLIGYFAVVMIYCAARAAQFARSSQGMTRRRMQGIALGSYFLGIGILLAGISAFVSGLTGVIAGLLQLCSVGAALSYAVGFTPPQALKRYWQIHELRPFLARSSTLPRATMAEIVDDLSGVVGRALGARATIGLWDEAARVLRFRDPHGALPHEMGPSPFIAWRAFASQRPIYVADVSRAHPENAEAYRRAGVAPVLVAPITAGDHRLGVLEVFAPRPPLFAADDLQFVELMAQQAAVLLESRALIDDAARVRAQEETARMKEDFVSAAAHDLKTPLTTIVAQAQLLEMRAEREGRTAELDGIRRLMRESGQLARLVEEILDASRIERGAFPLRPEDCDLVEIAHEVAACERPGSRRVEVVADGPVRDRADPDRVRQLLENLVENALKYSPEASAVVVRAWTDGASARLSVTDRGIGIPTADVAHVFERFRRGANVDHRHFGGIGLGLFICRGIVEQHGGRIWAESRPGVETTFHVSLPLAPMAAEPEDAIPADEVASRSGVGQG